MYFVSFWANYHHASSRPILIGNSIYVEDPLFCILFSDCRYFTVSRLIHFNCLDVACHPNYCDCIGIGEFYYEISKGLPLDCCSGAVVYVELS